MESASSDSGIAQEIRESLILRKSGNSETGRMPSGFTPVVIDLHPSMKVTIPWGKPSGIGCMPSGFTPVEIDLRPSEKGTIPCDKPSGIRCMSEGRSFR